MIPFNSIPSGVRAIAGVFALCGIYLGVCGSIMLALPGEISMAAGAPLLFGLGLSGPYMFLLIAVVAGGIAWGLLRLNNLVRRLAVVIAVAGVVMLVPSVSSATAMAQPRALAIGGFGIIARVIVVWYLSRGDVSDDFRRPFAR